MKKKLVDRNDILENDKLTSIESDGLREKIENLSVSTP